MERNIKNSSTGFTIIELIVVIAIIAVLAAIVLVNVTSYIAKGKDSSIKGNMSSMATIAAAFFDGHSSSFVGLLTDPTFKAAVAAINDANGSSSVTDVVPQAIVNSWCVKSKLNDTTVANWCVDTTGYKGNSAAVCNGTAATCN